MSWSNVAPDVRQKKLEEVTGIRLADVFFTIFDAEGKTRIYISETIENTMNPDFKYFDLRDQDPSITRSSEFQINLWAKPEISDEPMHLGMMSGNLRSLHWVCKTLVCDIS